MKRCAGAGLRLHTHASSEALDLLPHNSQSKASSGDVGNEGAGGNSGLKYERKRISLAHEFRFFGGDDSLFHSRCFHSENVDPGTIVREIDINLAVVPSLN